MNRYLTVAKAHTMGDRLLPGLIINIEHPLRVETGCNEAMQREGQELCDALHNVLPQGTWAALVAAVASAWAADNSGILPAHMMGKGTAPDVPNAVALLRAIRDLAPEQLRFNLADVLHLLGAWV